MSLIIGVVCDSCGASDVEETVDGRSIDNFPRNNWFSITQWEGQDRGRPEAELHVCSFKCMEDLPKTLVKEASKEKHNNDRHENGHGHGHEHTH